MLLNELYLQAMIHGERKKIHFDIESCGTKIRPGKVGNWRIFDSN